jgi:hypothetical protein
LVEVDVGLFVAPVADEDVADFGGSGFVNGIVHDGASMGQVGWFVEDNFSKNLRTVVSCAEEVVVEIIT